MGIVPGRDDPREAGNLDARSAHLDGGNFVIALDRRQTASWSVSRRAHEEPRPWNWSWFGVAGA